MQPLLHEAPPRRSARDKALFVAEAFARNQLFGEPLPSTSELEAITASITDRQAAGYNRILEVEHRVRLFLCRDVELKQQQVAHQLERLAERLEALALLTTLEPLPLPVSTRKNLWQCEVPVMAEKAAEALAESKMMARAALQFMAAEEAEIPSYVARLRPLAEQVTPAVLQEIRVQVPQIAPSAPLYQRIEENLKL